ncbi:DNA topoisomerase VI subunit B, partial [bacterium]
PEAAERLIAMIRKTKIPSPPTNCLSPIGEERIEASLREQFEGAAFYTAVTRTPSVYRGNPFQVEVGIAYGGALPADELATVYRYANRVPLQYQAGACAVSKAVLQTNWRSYGMQQSRGALPSAPMVLMVHIASVWVPFTSESKEAVASYDEILKEFKLALQEGGRKLGRFIRRGQRERDEAKKRAYIDKYIPHVGLALREILDLTPIEEAEIVATLSDTLERSRKI